jgi:hypothetical protein
MVQVAQVAQAAQAAQEAQVAQAAVLQTSYPRHLTLPPLLQSWTHS